MDNIAKIHVHPRNSNETILGFKLSPGDVIQEGDLYDASSGYWNTCLHTAGQVLKINQTYWVRLQCGEETMAPSLPHGLDAVVFGFSKSKKPLRCERPVGHKEKHRAIRGKGSDIQQVVEW